MPAVISKFFIVRPIVAIVIAILTVALGAISALSLPLAQYPQIVPPIVQVTATYPGANAMQVQESVATPIEQQVTGVEGMLYMRSINSSVGNMTLQASFGIDTDPSIDQDNVNIRLQNAMSELPKEVNAEGLTVRMSVFTPMMLVEVYSPNGEYDREFLSNYAYIHLNDPIARVYGVGQTMVFGAAEYAMRIWLRPDKLATYGIRTQDVTDAIEAQNSINPLGRIGAEPSPPSQELTYSITGQGRLVTPEEFADIVIKAKDDGSMVRVGDVARVELGAQNYNNYATRGKSGVAIIDVEQAPGTNAVESAKRIRALMEELSEDFPPGIEYRIALDTTLAVTAGIYDIVITLVIALGLVILVVFLFLQGWRATLIPLVAVPVALIGTFIFFPALGFSINTLSLFGMVLAVGLVVDDAIVVVEASHRHVDAGMPPKEAALQAMKEVTGPVVAVALILAAVFIPTAAIPGITGQLYKQFAVTIAISVLLSAFNALTLSPALCAMLLRPSGNSRGPLRKFYVIFNRWFGKTRKGYVKVSHYLVRRVAIAILALVAVTVGAYAIGKDIPSAFIPDEDQGYYFIEYQLPAGASMQRTRELAHDVGKLIEEVPGVESYINVQGFDFIAQTYTTFTGNAFITLKPWSERKSADTQIEAIVARTNELLDEKITGGLSFAFAPPPIPGIGAANGFDLMIQDRAGKGPEYLEHWTDKFVEAAKKRPEVGSIRSNWIPSVPQQRLVVDRDQVKTLGIEVEQVYATLADSFGSTYVNLFNRFGRTWRVYVQADHEYRDDTDGLDLIYVQNNQGEMVPLSAVAHWETTYGPEFTTRVNEYMSAELVGKAAKGHSSNDVMTALEEVADEVLPRDMGTMWYGMSYQQNLARTGIPVGAIFGMSLFSVFLIMAAQYESWAVPLAVLLGTPVAVLGGLAALMLRGYENSVYAQIGLVMLIGLAAKNAILIVEFAKARYDEGEELVRATLAGARLRLRPIIMTALAFIMGTVPLAVATGAGAVGRRVLGSVVIGGMLTATFLAIFIIPVAFVVVMRLFRVKRRDRHEMEKLVLPPSGNLRSEG